MVPMGMNYNYISCSDGILMADKCLISLQWRRRRRMESRRPVGTLEMWMRKERIEARDWKDVGRVRSGTGGEGEWEEEEKSV